MRGDATTVRLAAISWLLAAAAGAAAEPGDTAAGRARALRRIAESRRADAQAVLVAAAADPAPLVRQTAVLSAARYVRRPGPELRRAVRRILYDAHGLVVLAAVEALQAHPDPAARGRLAELVRRPPRMGADRALPASVYGRSWASGSVIAEEAFAALRKLDWSADVGVLKKLLAGRDAGARVAAAQAVGAMAGKIEPSARPGVVSALAASAKCPHRRARRAAAEALVKLGAQPPPDVVPKKLTAADRALLERFFAIGLFDPRGATRVEATYGDARQPVRFVPWRRRQREHELLWRLPAGQDRPAGLYGRWGRAVTGVEVVRAVDFAAEARAAAKALAVLSGGVGGWGGLHDAAWLYRLGHEADAAGTLFGTRGLDDADELLQRFAGLAAGELALDAAAAFARSADADAIDAISRARKAGGRWAPTTALDALAAELARRKAAGTLGRKPRPLPAELGTWPAARRVELLIAALEDVAVEPTGGPAPPDLSSDPRVMALIEVGEPAVEALIGCVEADTRLTRTMHFTTWAAPPILGVREAALVAVQSILRWSFFEPDHPGDSLTRRGPAAAADVAGRLRAYWRTQRSVPLGRRMMHVLADANAPPAALRTAAKNLASLAGTAVFGTMAGTSRLVKRGTGPSPAVARFRDPTAAEAILAAMGRDLGLFDRRYGSAGAKDDPRRVRVEVLYARALTALGDRAVAGKLLDRYRAATAVEAREAWAHACDHLGRPEALRDFRRRRPATRPAR